MFVYGRVDRERMFAEQAEQCVGNSGLCLYLSSVCVTKEAIPQHEKNGGFTRRWQLIGCLLWQSG